MAEAEAQGPEPGAPVNQCPVNPGREGDWGHAAVGGTFRGPNTLQH